MADFDLDDTVTSLSFQEKVAAMRATSPRRAAPAPVAAPAPAERVASLPLTRQGLVWAIALGGALDRPRCRR